jgi:LacI family transcriptional regulator
MRALRSAGLKIPEDVSVMGHDDVSASTLVTPTLTTVQVAKHDMSSISCQLLFDRAENPKRPPQHILTAERLMVRESVRNLCGGALQAVNTKIMP